jgi:predicted phosphoribosyltransferase
VIPRLPAGNLAETDTGCTEPMVPVAAFAAGGWWVGLSVASVLIAVLATLVVTVITLVNRIELQAASITDSLTATGERTRPLLDLVESNLHLDTILKGGR